MEWWSDGVMEWWEAGEQTLLHHSNTPSLHLLTTPSTSRLHFDHIMRGGLAHAGGGDANITGHLAQLCQVRRAQVAQTGLNAANQLRQDSVERGRNFLERFDPFGRDLLGAVRGLAVTG